MITDSGGSLSPGRMAQLRMLSEMASTKAYASFRDRAFWRGTETPTGITTFE
jgi:hypothetical protein